MQYTIYFDSKPLVLTDTPEARPASPEDSAYLNGLSPTHLQQALTRIRSATTDKVVFFHQPLEQLKEAIWKQFTIIQAAGGLVFNNNGEMLFIYRRGKWDLPKGKLDPGETLPECAVREVQEETGISGLKLERELLVTYHHYQQDGADILKETYWYQMQATGETTLTAQAEEDILEARWLSDQDLARILSNTYQAIKDVLNTVSRPLP